MINGLFIAGLLIGLGFLVRTPIMLLLNLVGMPGALLTLGDPKAIGYKSKFVLGTLISFICQSFTYYAYVAFVVKSLQHIPQDSMSFGIVFVWLAAMFASLSPIHYIRYMAYREHLTDGESEPNAILNALSMVWLGSLVVFILFALAPSIMNILWGWVPSF